MNRNPVLALAAVATLATLGLAELALRVVWTNPYRTETDRVLILKTHPPGMERRYPRALIAPDDPEVTLRIDARSYIAGVDPPASPLARIAFLGGSTTECSVHAVSGAESSSARTSSVAAAMRTRPDETTWASTLSPVQSRTCTS